VVGWDLRYIQHNTPATPANGQEVKGSLKANAKRQICAEAFGQQARACVLDAEAFHR
jgi:hypothetical protein